MKTYEKYFILSKTSYLYLPNQNLRGFLVASSYPHLTRLDR